MSRRSGSVAVAGAGAFGTALACVLAKATDETVLLLSRDRELADAINSARRNERSLPGIDLPRNIRATSDRAKLRQAALVLLAMPAQEQGQAVAALRADLDPASGLVICAKGIEQASGRFLSRVVGDAAPGHSVSVLSGPGFAADIARGLPTAMTVANPDLAAAEAAAAQLSGSTFRLYASDDVAGVEIGGALKNVLAIACGIVDGAGLGKSARAALIARGLVELSRFAAAHGGRVETMSGLSGLGDLVLTGTSTQSRNFRYGVELGGGADPRDLARTGGPLCEGAFTASVAARIARERAIEMPITSAVAAIVDGAVTVEHAITALMNRPLKTEGEAGRPPAT